MRHSLRRASLGVWSSGVCGALAAALLAGCGPNGEPASSSSTAALPPPAEQATAPTPVADAAGRVEAIAAAAPVSLEHGAGLYAQHCAACHGENGNGAGPAAKFLYPKPRNFRAGQFRLVSTSNNVPTRQDLEDVLVRGMPGSSMVSWAHLSAEDRSALVDQVLAFRRGGARDVELQLAAEEELELSEEELAENIARVTSPGESLAVPEIGVATAEAIERGKQLYASKGCVSCHGATGKGDGQQQMIDNEGIPTRPRDLTLGIFKGNHDPASIFRRLWLGMPGTPMPASQQLSQTEVIEMTQFVLSLSDETARRAKIMRRAKLRAARVAQLPSGPSDAAWDAAGAVGLQTTPLWWRDEAARQLTVQTLHDGKTLALRLVWQDATHNDSAVRPDEFEDLAAVQVYQGPREPFLGMGAHGSTVDLWQWRAGTKQDGAERWQSDEYPFDTAIYRELFPDREMPDFLAARAAGNPLASRDASAASLAAVGFGSLTYRPKASQVVAAEGVWSEGRWQVQLTRPLAPGAEQGVELSPGTTCSLAVALWDGAARDRAGQKLITLWNDLTVE